MLRISRYILAAVCLGLIVLPCLSAPASYNQAVKDYSAGKYAVALSEFQAYKAAYPNNALVHYYIGLCQQSLGRIDQAKAEYQWVAGNGDAQLKSKAEAGLNQLSRVHSSGGNFVSSGSTHQAAGASTRIGGKVRRVLDFYADWCGPCRAFGPVFEEVKSRMRDISFERYNVDEETTNEIRSKCPPFSTIPHVVFMDGGGKVLYDGTPPTSAESFEREISQYR